MIQISRSLNLFISFLTDSSCCFVIGFGFSLWVNIPYTVIDAATNEMDFSEHTYTM